MNHWAWWIKIENEDLKDEVSGQEMSGLVNLEGQKDREISSQNLVMGWTDALVDALDMGAVAQVRAVVDQQHIYALYY